MPMFKRVLRLSAAWLALLVPMMAQSPPPPPQAEKGGAVKKEDVSVYAALILLQDNLPRGTRMTSGFRTANDQLRIIRHDAQIEGLAVPNNMTLDKPEIWRPILLELRKRGYTIADPDKTPHSSNDLIVFDLAGANLDQIIKGVQVTQSRGLIRISKIIKERVNQAVHVELEVTPKGLYALGVQQPINTTGPGESDPTIAQDLRLLNEAHERAKDNPAKQIDLDRIILQRLSPSDITGQRRIEEEIQEHQKRLTELALNAKKQAALDEIHQSEQEGRSEEALGLARRFKENFPNEPESQTIVAQYETPLLVGKALDLFLKGDCDDCLQARELVDSALKLAPSDSMASRIAREIDSTLSTCRTRTILRIFFIVLLIAALLVVVYLFIRQGNWVLVVVDGSRKEEMFPLTQPEHLIGALGPPDGEADIEVGDRKRKISRTHCKIVQDGRKFYIKDLSANGTKVNGQPLENGEYRRLRRNDEISLADEVTLLFRRR
ncbi:MAG TPA: FHA domain-containing protein [Blastocatellia bacterium]|nr:FHA domain-containing protein [Blastocatellia bacterium]